MGEENKKTQDDQKKDLGVTKTESASVQELHAEVIDSIKALEKKVEEQCREIEEKSVPIQTLSDEIAEQKSSLEALQQQLTEYRAEARKREAVTRTSDSISSRVLEDARVKSFLERGHHEGHVVCNLEGFGLHEQKTTIDSSAVGSSTAGILTPARVRDIVYDPERRFTIRDLLPVSTTTSNAVEFPQEDTFTNLASPQTEASDKDESALTFTIATANVRTIAHWIPATRQVLDDWPALGRAIDRKLMYGLKLKEEDEILTGSGAGVHLNGIQTQATAYETGRTKTNDSILDFLRHAISQIEEANEGCDFIVLHPSDFWEAMGVKDQDANQGNYVVGQPAALPQPMTLWGKAVISTNAQTADTFLVGWSQQAEVFDRMQASIVISTEHSDYFIKNMVAIRAEERLALAVYRTTAFVTGDVSSASPL